MRSLILLLAILAIPCAGCSWKARPKPAPAPTTEKLPPEVEFDPAAAAKLQARTGPKPPAR